MMTNLKYWLKGLAVAAVSMIIYAVALGCYMALMLLVISMESLRLLGASYRGVGAAQPRYRVQD